MSACTLEITLSDLREKEFILQIGDTQIKGYVDACVINNTTYNIAEIVHIHSMYIDPNHITAFRVWFGKQFRFNNQDTHIYKELLYIPYVLNIYFQTEHINFFLDSTQYNDLTILDGLQGILIFGIGIKCRIDAWNCIILNQPFGG